jgi:hypothetical protein
MNQFATHGAPHNLLKSRHTGRPGAIHRPPGLLLFGSVPPAFPLAVTILGLIALLVIFSSH